MTFQQLLQGAEVLSQRGDASISSVEYDSRRVKPGALFVAMWGETSDGNKFIDKAIAAGAVAVVSDSATEAPRPGVAWAQVAHGRRALARISANFYKHPAEKLAKGPSGGSVLPPPPAGPEAGKGPARPMPSDPKLAGREKKAQDLWDRSLLRGRHHPRSPASPTRL